MHGPPHHRLDGHAEPSVPLLLVRRNSKAATFAAVHEPYSDGPSIQNIALIEESAEGIGMKVEANGFSDRLLVGFGSSSKTILLRSPDGEMFRFAGYGFLRMEGGAFVARGKIDGFRVHANRIDISLTLNGKKEAARARDGFLVFGDIPAEGNAASSPTPPEMAETRASVHSYFLPEELRLKAGSAREVAMNCSSETTLSPVSGIASLVRRQRKTLRVRLNWPRAFKISVFNSRVSRRSRGSAAAQIPFKTVHNGIASRHFSRK